MTVRENVKDLLKRAIAAIDNGDGLGKVIVLLGLAIAIAAKPYEFTDQ